MLLRRGALGDVLLLGSVSASLPGRVTILTAPEWVEAARRLRGVDEVLPWPRDRSPRQLARSLPPGRLVDLHGSLRSRILCAWAGGAHRRLHKHSLRRRLRLRLPGLGLQPRPSVPSVYAEACGVRPAPLPWIEIPARPRRDLVLIPSASWATKRWPVQSFAAVAGGWAGDVVVLGGPGEEPRCEAVAAGLPRATVLCERGFARTLDALSRARVAIAGDSGLMHLAGATGTPLIAIFGPTDPEDGFFVYPGRVVQRALPCRPCSLTGDAACPLDHHACMQQLNPEDVRAAMQQLLTR